MREIKFRAWFKQGERMLPPEYFTLHQDEDGYYIVANSTQSIMKDIKLMQYTGLKDKHGVEIYEDDLLFYGHFIEPHRILHVNYAHGEFYTNSPGSDDYSGLRAVVKGGRDYYEDMFHEGGAVVIGNIHENPEILEKS